MSDIQLVESKIEVEEGENHIKYVGTQENLINAGVATEDMFPVWPKRVIFCSEPNELNCLYWSIKRIKGGRFVFIKGHEQKTKNSMPKPMPWNPQDYRLKVANIAGIAFSLFDNLMNTEEFSVHKMSDADLEKLDSLRCQYIETVLTARVEGFGRRGHLEIVR